MIIKNYISVGYVSLGKNEMLHNIIIMQCLTEYCTNLQNLSSIWISTKNIFQVVNEGWCCCPEGLSNKAEETSSNSKRHRGSPPEATKGGRAGIIVNFI